MNCPKCSRPMLALFTSFVCDYCDALKKSLKVVQDVEYDKGYIIWQKRPLPLQKHVFRTVRSAEIWRRLRNIEEYPIVEILTMEKFQWNQSSLDPDLFIASHLFEVYATRCHPPRSHCAFLSDREGA